jgi:hypothetical protein
MQTPSLRRVTRAAMVSLVLLILGMLAFASTALAVCPGGCNGNS